MTERGLIETENKPVWHGKVGEVTEKEDQVLVPLIPQGHDHTAQFLTTIAFDLLRLGYSKAEIGSIYGDSIGGEWTPAGIRQNIRSNGRTVITEFREVGPPVFETVEVDDD